MIMTGLTGSVSAEKQKLLIFENKFHVFESDYEINLLYKKRVVIKKLKKSFQELLLIII